MKEKPTNPKTIHRRKVMKEMAKRMGVSIPVAINMLAGCPRKHRATYLRISKELREVK